MNPKDSITLRNKVQMRLEAEGVIGVIKMLRDKQLRFVEEYVKDYNATAAVLRAGYDVDRRNAGRMGNGLMGHPAIKVAIEHYSELRQKQVSIDAKAVMDRWVLTIAENEEKAAKGDAKAAAIILRASELIAKALGMFTEKVEHTGKDGGAIQVEETRDAADAFARSITGLAARGGEVGSPLEARSRD